MITTILIIILITSIYIIGSSNAYASCNDSLIYRLEGELTKAKEQGLTGYEINHELTSRRNMSRVYQQRILVAGIVWLIAIIILPFLLHLI